MNFQLFHRLALAVLLVATSLVAAATTDLDFGFDGTLSAEGSAVETTVYAFQDSINGVSGPGFFRDFVNPSPAFGLAGDDSFLTLAQDDFIGIPPEILQNFDTSEAIQLDIRFRFSADEPVVAPSPCCPNYIHRSVLTSHDGDQRSLGFNLRIQQIEERWQLILVVGGGINEASGLQNEGFIFFLGDAQPDRWIDASLIFRLAEARPRVEVLLDGRPISGGLNDPFKIDLPLLRDHLEGGPGLVPDRGLEAAQLFVGGFPYLDPRGADIDLAVDRVRLQAPKAPADSALLRQVLARYADFVSGASDPGEAALRADLQAFLAAFNGDWTPIADAALAYFTAYEAAYPPLFESSQLVSVGSFDAPSLLTYFLQQWLLDSLFVDGRVGEIAGVGFEAAESFPGAVAPEAPRVTGSVGVDATYRKDPAIQLNQDEAVIRPTGFYAPPGEAVTVRVPPVAVAAGLKVRIGIQRADMEAGNWFEFNRFPRISTRFTVTDTATLIANPFGGGIYFEIPDGAEVGVISVEVAGAVRMPMFSTLDLPGHSDNLAMFTAGVADWYVPWFEMHSRNFSMTDVMNVASLYTDPPDTLAAYDNAFDQIDRMAGRPAERYRAEWWAADRFITVSGTALTASYPIYPNRDIGERFDSYPADTFGYSPLVMLQENFFAPPEEDFLPERYSNYILWHEWGHVHNLPTLGFQEQESNVHLLAAVVYNQTLGADLDTALARSGFQNYGFDEAALDTMFSPNWQAGNRLSEGEQIYGIWDNEVRYQTRSWARIVEIAGLYDWDAVSAIHGAFYDRGAATGTAVNYGVEDDDFIETASASLGLNLAPIFDFWGVPPSAEAAARSAAYPVPGAFLDRLQRYRDIAPRTLADFMDVYDRLTPTASNEGRIRWDYFASIFDAALGNTIVARIDDIGCRYFGCLNAGGAVVPANLQATNSVNDRVRLSWADAPNEARYLVYRCPREDVTDGCELLAEPGANTTAFSDLEAEPDVDHYYRIRSCESATSCSGFSSATAGRIDRGRIFVDGFEGSAVRQ